MNAAAKAYEFVEEDGEYLTLRVLGEIDTPKSRELENGVKKYIELSPRPMVVNCEKVDSISVKWIRILLDTQNKLKQKNSQLVLVSPQNDFKTFLKLEGVDNAFQLVANLKEAKEALKVQSKKLKFDIEFINPFLTATLHVLKVQAGINAEAGKIALKKAEELLVGDVSGIIGIVCDAFNGSVIISFPEKTFLKVMSGMLGEEYTELNKEILDGAGEITNMIFGQAKIVLNEKGYGIKMALPSVVSGKGHSMTTLAKGKVLVIPFTSDGGDFFVEVCLSV